eukprot:2243126-Prymnesium_polylepis.1
MLQHLEGRGLVECLLDLVLIEPCERNVLHDHLLVCLAVPDENGLAEHAADRAASDAGDSVETG